MLPENCEDITVPNINKFGTTSTTTKRSVTEDYGYFFVG